MARQKWWDLISRAQSCAMTNEWNTSFSLHTEVYFMRTTHTHTRTLNIDRLRAIWNHRIDQQQFVCQNKNWQQIHAYTASEWVLSSNIEQQGREAKINDISLSSVDLWWYIENLSVSETLRPFCAGRVCQISREHHCRSMHCNAIDWAWCHKIRSGRIRSSIHLHAVQPAVHAWNFAKETPRYGQYGYHGLTSWRLM